LENLQQTALHSAGDGLENDLLLGRAELRVKRQGQGLGGGQLGTDSIAMPGGRLLQAGKSPTPAVLIGRGEDCFGKKCLAMT